MPTFVFGNAYSSLQRIHLLWKSSVTDGDNFFHVKLNIFTCGVLNLQIPLINPKAIQNVC